MKVNNLGDEADGRFSDVDAHVDCRKIALPYHPRVVYSVEANIFLGRRQLDVSWIKGAMEGRKIKCLVHRLSHILLI